MEQNLSEKAVSILNNKYTKIYNKPKTLLNKLFKKEKKVTIITAAYNADLYIRKCVDSVIGQTLPFEQIEFIIVDDHSTDNTKEILLQYAKEYANITVVLLNENTGTAATPRNIGIELATTDKVMFLDSDDWIAENALLTLINTMEENDDDFVVGRTIKVEDQGVSVHAEFISYKERKHVSPFDIPYFFYHMGPPSKLIKTSILKENNIRFPEMKFGEDKFFLIQILLKDISVSVITTPVYYVNRLTTNRSSLTRTTEVLEKRESDMKTLKYLIEKNIPIDQEKEIMKRLVEYDLVKTCDSFVFIRSEEKHKFIGLIREALNLLSNRPYDIIDTFDSPLYQVAARLVEQKRDQDFIELFKWYKLDKNKEIVIKDDVAYNKVTPFSEHDPFKLIPINLLVRSKDVYVEDNEYVENFEIYGEYKDTISYVLIRDRSKLNNELKIPIKVEGNIGEFRVSFEDLNLLDNSLFSIFIRYDGHRLTNIKRILESQVTYDNRKFTFYTTKAGNLGFSLKD